MLKAKFRLSPAVVALFIAPLLLAGCERDGPVPQDAGADAGVNDDSGPGDTGDKPVGCMNAPLTAPSSGTCSFTAGSDVLLIRGDVVAPGTLLENGHVLVGADGKISCAQCDCSSAPGFSGASVLECADGVIAPAFINAHDHITFTEGPPVSPQDPDERYDHRNQWRRGQDGKSRIPSQSNTGGDQGVWWGELRMLMSGATSINGSGSAPGLLRNLDRNDNEGLNQPSVEYSTFPLGDIDGERLASGCGYPSSDSPSDYANNIAYAPHIAEGVDDTARNEFLCLSSDENGGTDVLDEKTAIIHGIGLLAVDYAAMAAEGASLIWSARTNIDLYGHTAQVVLARNTGVNIALGTDWTATGSMNMIRELVCVDQLNQRNLGGFFSDRELIDMATVNAATALKTGATIGALAPGRFADITIFNGATDGGYRALLNASPDDVVLVLRAGLPLYGDQDLLGTLPNTGSGCEALDVCGVMKSVCAERETGSTIAQMESAIASNHYPLFFCGEPAGEPTCVPFRPNEYMGVGSAADSDGDGIMDTMDNCPTVFNAARPMDDGVQPDADADMIGDACDACPLDQGEVGCAPPDPNDLDGDGTPNLQDNCPDTPNTDQADRDSDLIGDVCDACPDESNPGGAACSGNVYDIKQGNRIGAVRLNNMLVTGIAQSGFFTQTIEGDADYDAELGADFSGIYTFHGADPKPTIGDRIDLEGTVNDFFGQLQLNNATFTVLSSGNAPPTPVAAAPAELSTGGPRAAQLESVVVEIGAVTVTELEPEVGPGDTAPTFEFVVDGELRVNDYMYRAEPLPAVNDTLSFVRGVLRFGNGNSKLEPRASEDLGVEVQLSALTPPEVFAPAGINGVPAGGFAAVLNRAAESEVTVDLTSSSGELTVPASVVVQIGESQVDIPITAASPIAGPVVITASFDGRMVTANVTVYDDAAPRLIDTLALDRTSMPVNDVTAGSVSITLPGAVGGTSVGLTINPANLGTVPATVTIPEGAFSAPFDVTTAAQTGAGTLEAVAGDTAVINIDVVQSVSRPAGPGDLIITEVLRNPSGNNEADREWFEVHNPTTDEIELGALSVADNNGTTVLNTTETIPPGGYAIIANKLDPGTNGGVTAAAAYDNPDIALANGTDRIVLTGATGEVDRLEWSAGWPGSTNGTAMCLKFPYGDNLVLASWSDSIGTFGTNGDTGHPGVASSAGNCP